MHAIAKDFVLSCLRVDEKERFYSGKADVFGENIVRSHQWFQDVDWDDIEAKSFVPEWQPMKTLSGKMDLRCNYACLELYFVLLRLLISLLPDTRLM